MTFILTAVCNDKAQIFFEQMRQEHYPPDRNQIPALRVWRYLNGPWELVHEVDLPRDLS